MHSKIIPAIMWNIKLRLFDKYCKWIFFLYRMQFVSFLYRWIILTHFLSPGFQVFFSLKTQSSNSWLISRKRQSNNVIISLHYTIPFFVFCMTLGNITKSLTEIILWIFKHTWQYFVPANHFIVKTRKDRYRMLFLFMKNDIKVKTIVQIHVVTEGRGMCVHFCI